MFILIVILILINCIKCQNVLNSIWSFPLWSNKSLLIATLQVAANSLQITVLIQVILFQSKPECSEAFKHKNL